MKLRSAIVSDLKEALLLIQATPIFLGLVTEGTVNRADLVQFLKDALGQAFDDTYLDMAERAGGVPSVRQLATAAQADLFSEMAGSRIGAIKAVAGRAPDLSHAQVMKEITRAVQLTGADVTALSNYDSELKAGSRKALRRKLRDKRSDRSVVAEKAISPAKRALMVKRYEERLIRYRATVVARDAVRAAEQATLYAHWTDLEEAGDESAVGIHKFWENRDDGKVRHSHVEIPLDHPDGIPLKQAFVTLYGSIRYPLDPQASSKDRDGCRCRLRYGWPALKRS